MPNTEKFQAVIEVNSRQAMESVKALEAAQKKAMDELSRLKQKDSGATKEQIKAAELHLKSVSKALTEEKRHVKGLNMAMEQLSKKTYKELRQEVNALNRMMRDGTVTKNSKEWNALAERIKAAKKEMREYTEATQEHKSVWSQVFSFLQNSWGGVLVVFQAITGISQTIRKTVQDFSDIEEAMADTRKYTGLTDEAIRDLNEDLKRMDTRTSRAELNELAGAAGRLGKTAKEDILDFVEAGNMIKVALGDDLGEGAIDKVGKLAMAFGEDEKMGLRGAMLATGSAINELAQNSSAQAGYLVDFTARVAGFGKQLGLTQAQIMGFGAVMDENLLRDEMSATAFGNMLTKMQTDTAKFAKIAGKDVKEFTKLLRADANAAILAVADSLKRADPQTMMKMLDDMGLDGSRAVGVLSTLADKIDDVRERQKLATKAYKEGTSVQNEYNTMNNTVQAGIDKAKKQFQEMSIELGQRLLPIVKYTISSASMVINILNTITRFVIENRKALLLLTAAIVANTAVYKAAEIRAYAWYVKEQLLNGLHKAGTALLMARKAAVLTYNAAVALLTGNITRATAAMRLMRAAAVSNPYGAILTVVLALATAIYGVAKAWSAHKKAVYENLQAVKELRAQQQLQKDLNKSVAESTAEEKTKIERLTKVIRSNAYTVDERRKAIKTLQSIVPDYHASISKEGKLYNENSAAIKNYITDLNNAALAEAIYAKKVEINRKKMELSFKESRIQGSLKAVQAERDAHPEMYQNETRTFSTGRGTFEYEVESDAMTKSRQQQAIHEKRLANVKSEQQVLEKEDQFLDTMLKKNEKLNKYYNNKATGSGPTTSTTNGSGEGASTYTSTADEKAAAKAAKAKSAAERKAEAQRRREEAQRKQELKERADAAKASYQEELAGEMLSYRQGLKAYTDFMEDRHKLTQNYYDKLKEIYGEDSNEYKKALLQQEKDEQEYNQWKLKQSDEKLIAEKLQREYNIKMQYARKEVYDEDELNENLFKSDIAYLKQKQNLYKKSSKEWYDIEQDIQQREREHQFEVEMNWMDRLSQYRQEMGRINYEKMEKIEIDGVESFYGALVEKGLMAKEEYDSIIAYIKNKYAELSADQMENNRTENKASRSLDTAKKKAGVRDVSAGDNAASGFYSITQAIENQKLVNEQLKLLYGEDYENNREYQEAKRQLDQETMSTIVAGAQAAFSTINSLMSAASSYAQACSDVEVARITANYDKQIEAAGKNTKKREKLEKEKDKAIAKAKTAANKKAMKIEVAQALASTAMAALNAYSSTAEIPIVGPALAPVAAAIAVAASMLQVATIKKQHEAQSAGYYEGGFTGGSRYRKEAGVVHEGEFVANHQAVNNPQLAPMFQLIDQAQRDNRVASLTAEDVSRSMGGGSAAVVAPVVNVQTDNEQLNDTLKLVKDSIGELNQQLLEGINATVAIDGPQGLHRQYTRYLKMTERA